MNKNLNENLYRRFGLDIDRKKVENGFRKYVANEIWEATYLFRRMNSHEEIQNQLYEAREGILDDCCREIFLDRSEYKYDSLWDYKEIAEFIDDILDGAFEQILINMQILLNSFYKYKIVSDELEDLSEELQKYAEDFPILGIIIKKYKTKAPQILPLSAKYLNQEILDTLGVLDVEKFHNVLNDFELAVKLFAKARNDSDLKNVIANLHASCDEVVKVVLNNKCKSFKSITDKVDHKKLGLNGKQKEIFKQIKSRMDDIKHGNGGQIDRDEVEMIVGMSAAFLRFVAVKYNKKDN